MTAYVGLGANLGDPRRAVLEAMEALSSIPTTRCVRASSLYRSDPVGYANQPPFVNAVAEVSTALSAHELLEALMQIEAQAGRERSFANAPRTLDLDLLLYGEAVIDEPGLSVPHPRMHQRRFVLEPLLEIAPDTIIPGRGRADELAPGVAAQGLQRMSP